jgi:glyoxylase-like metal-dependent hydrolase (beta-lactamase superfamily II)
MTYILVDEEVPDVWIVDCGDVDALIEKLLDLKGGVFSIKGTLLTHAHYDHIYGLPKLTDLFPDIKVYTNSFGKKLLESERLNMSRYHEDPINYMSKNLMECVEGDAIDLFDGVQAKVHHTPGHCPSCLSYEIGDFLFTGDAYIPGVKVVTTLRGSDKQQAIQSVERLLAMSKGKIICPGHEVKV